MIDVTFGVAEGVATATDLSGENATIVLNAEKEGYEYNQWSFHRIIELHYFLLSEFLDQAFKALIRCNILQFDV